MLMSDLATFMSILKSIITNILNACPDLFTIVAFCFSAFILLAVFKAVAYRHGG